MISDRISKHRIIGSSSGSLHQNKNVITFRSIIFPKPKRVEFTMVRSYGTLREFCGIPQLSKFPWKIFAVGISVYRENSQSFLRNSDFSIKFPIDIKIQITQIPDPWISHWPYRQIGFDPKIFGATRHTNLLYVYIDFHETVKSALSSCYAVRVSEIDVMWNCPVYCRSSMYPTTNSRHKLECLSFKLKMYCW